METKTVDLGDGWTAEIKRPSIATWIEWRYLSQPEVKEIIEKGKDPESEKVSDRLPAAAFEFLEKRLVPEATMAVMMPNGEVLDPSKVYWPDLGTGRFDTLASAVILFIAEAGKSPFRAPGESEVGT
jgi:hypothetical protein